MTEPKPIGEWTLEQFVQGELPAEQQDALRQRVETDAALARRVQALRDSDREILERHPARSVAAAVRARAEAARARRARWIAPGALAFAGAAAAIVLAVHFVPRPLPIAEGVGEPGERIKGAEPRLFVFEVDGGKAVRLDDGARVSPGKTVQLQYVAAGKRYGAIVSIDGRGGVTLHWPVRPDAPARLEPGKASLPDAFQLDDAPGFERFFFVTSTSPIAAADVLSAADLLAREPDARSAPLRLPAGWEQSSLLLDKEHP